MYHGFQDWARNLLKASDLGGGRLAERAFLGGDGDLFALGMKYGIGYAGGRREQHRQAQQHAYAQAAISGGMDFQIVKHQSPRLQPKR